MNEKQLDAIEVKIESLMEKSQAEDEFRGLRQALEIIREARFLDPTPGEFTGISRDQMVVFCMMDSFLGLGPYGEILLERGKGKPVERGKVIPITRDKT